LLARREKVMGFGHRVYKVVDPRALILKEFSQELAKVKGEPKWFDMSEKLETLMKMRKGIDMNVDFYSASTYYYMGVQPDLFTCIFAISRVSGWVAHVLEQFDNNRLIRPRANWIGHDRRDFVPLDQRG
jgi:citrate synthase